VFDEHRKPHGILKNARRHSAHEEVVAPGPSSIRRRDVPGLDAPEAAHPVQRVFPPDP
jgi:hypothetical protein